jgi:hypothetical protein
MPTLEELDGEDWGEPNFPSYLVTTCHRLRKKDIDAFTVEDFRTLVGQTIGMRFLVPRVIALLEADPFAEGDFFPGDLLSALVRERNWTELADVAPRVRMICERARAAIASVRDDMLPDGRSMDAGACTTLDGEFKRYIDSN